MMMIIIIMIVLLLIIIVIIIVTGRLICKMLCHLSVVEPGDNLPWKQFRFIDAFDCIVQ